MRKLQRDPKQRKAAFRLTDQETNTPIIDCNQQLHRITEHYQTFFNTAVPDPTLEAFPQEFTNQPLDIPISSEEIFVASQALTNGKATGPDQLPAEALKYIDIDQSNFHIQLATTLNNMFTTSQPIEATQNAYLCPFNKPKGTPVVTNLRPISLLNSIRKLLEIMTLNRLRPHAEQYIGSNQSAQRNRSTADIIWTIRYLQAYAIKTGRPIYCLGIDLSKAFDTVDRTLLLTILKPIVPRDIFRLIQYLLAHTLYYPKIFTNIAEAFLASTGVPQGGALSVALFTGSRNERNQSNRVTTNLYNKFI